MHFTEFHQKRVCTLYFSENCWIWLKKKQNAWRPWAQPRVCVCVCERLEAPRPIHKCFSGESSVDQLCEFFCLHLFIFGACVDSVAIWALLSLPLSGERRRQHITHTHTHNIFQYFSFHFWAPAFQEVFFTYSRRARAAWEVDSCQDWSWRMFWFILSLIFLACRLMFGCPVL